MNTRLALVADSFDGEASTMAAKRTALALVPDWIPVPLVPSETINPKCAAAAICSMLSGVKQTTGR